MGARETALNALIACRKSGAWPNGALKEYIARDRLSPRDAALATRLCYGVHAKPEQAGLRPEAAPDGARWKTSIPWCGTSSVWGCTRFMSWTRSQKAPP